MPCASAPRRRALCPSRAGESISPSPAPASRPAPWRERRGHQGLSGRQTLPHTNPATPLSIQQSSNQPLTLLCMADYDARVLCSVRRPPSVRPLLGPTPRVGALTATSRALYPAPPAAAPPSQHRPPTRWDDRDDQENDFRYNKIHSAPPHPSAPRSRAASLPCKVGVASRRAASQGFCSGPAARVRFACQPWPAVATLGPGATQPGRRATALPAPYSAQFQKNYGFI